MSESIAPAADPVAAAPAPVAAPPPVAPASAASVPIAPSAASDAPSPSAAISAQEAPKPAEAAADAPRETTPEPSLLSDAKPEAAPEAAPAPEPLTYTDFTWPEGVTPKADELAPYTAVLAQHQVPQEAAQQLVDLYVAEQKRAAQQQIDVWTQTRKGWQDQFRQDAELGKNRADTTLSRAAEVINRFGGTETQRQELRDALTATGAGDHPSVIRLLANVAAAFGEGRPVPAVPSTKTPASDRRNPLSRYPTMRVNGGA